MLEKEVMGLFIENKLQLTKDGLEEILKADNPLSVSKEILENISEKEFIINQKTIKKIFPSKKKQNKIEYKILENHYNTVPFEGISSMTSYFNSRYNTLRTILRNRVNNPVSIKYLPKLGKEQASLIGLVVSKRTTKNGYIIIELEDPTGRANIISRGAETKQVMSPLVNDEVIAVSGKQGDGVFFVDEVFEPDIPIRPESSHFETDSSAAFVSDIHMGSKNFLKDEFTQFLNFLNQNTTDEFLNELAKKVRYVFVAGDIVEGVGVYPTQEKELEIKDIYKQYQETAKYLSKIPEKIKIFLIPGNHDISRLAQPQPPIDKDAAPELYELSNTEMLSNPSLIGLKENQKTLKILLYHGVSIDTMVSTDPELKDGYTRPEKVMQALIKKRHLSPQYESRLVTSGEDLMTIPEDLDVFHTGHVHSVGLAKYRGVTLINAGTWQAKTDFQRLCGHEPAPAKAPLMNLKTKEIKLIDFAK